MMRVRFLQDYRGVLTHEQFHAKDSEVELDESTALSLIADGRAVAAASSEVAPADSPGAPPRGGSSTKRRQP